jgi:hypothetical protein
MLPQKTTSISVDLLIILLPIRRRITLLLLHCAPPALERQVSRQKMNLDPRQNENLRTLYLRKERDWSTMMM